MPLESPRLSVIHEENEGTPTLEIVLPVIAAPVPLALPLPTPLPTPTPTPTRPGNTSAAERYCGVAAVSEKTHQAGFSAVIDGRLVPCKQGG